MKWRRKGRSEKCIAAGTASSRVVEPTSRLSTAMHLKPPQAKLSPRFALNSDSPPVPCAFTSIILPGVRANANATTHIINRARNHTGKVE